MQEFENNNNKSENEDELKQQAENIEGHDEVETQIIDDTSCEIESEVKKKYDIKKEIEDWIVSIAIAVVVALVIRNYVFTLVKVDGPSMNPTLTHGDLLYTNRFMYEPEQGDIVIFRPPHSPETPYVKRVIAVAGQSVTINAQEHSVIVDGRILAEDYIKEPLLSAGIMQYPVKVPEGYIFVLGDNRNNSTDSRTIGLIPVENVIGKATFRILPVSQMGSLYL